MAALGKCVFPRGRFDQRYRLICSCTQYATQTAEGQCTLYTQFVRKRSGFSSNQQSSESKGDQESVNFDVSKEQILKTDPSAGQLQLQRGKSIRGLNQRLKLPTLPPRYKRMPVDQTWSDVWPTATTFKASAVPFPVRQGYTEKGEAPPAKYANAELMKIPNFLHLTPPAVEKHCNAIRKFCTPWPDTLVTDEVCKTHFPLVVTTTTYCHSSASIRNPLARVVTVKLRLSALNLDYHARDKFIRLVGARYNSENDEVTIVTDTCPMKKQNYDYAIYLLTACYFESQKVEPWEVEKAVEDWETYVWDMYQSKSTTFDIIKRTFALRVENDPGILPNYVERLTNDSDEEIEKLDEVSNMRDALNALYNDGESREALKGYKEATKTLLGLNNVFIPAD